MSRFILQKGDRLYVPTWQGKHSSGRARNAEVAKPPVAVFHDIDIQKQAETADGHGNCHLEFLFITGVNRMRQQALAGHQKGVVCILRALARGDNQAALVGRRPRNRA